jgi:hypothetical protein
VESNKRPDIAAIRARADAATPGPWEWEITDDWRGDFIRRHHQLCSQSVCDPGIGDPIKHVLLASSSWGRTEPERDYNPTPQDAAAIAHAREDVLVLCDYVEALEVEMMLLEKMVWAKP